MGHERDNSQQRAASWPGLLVFAASFCLYALSASPALGWLDSPEFVAQAVSLGVAHSPGHPLPALLGRLATLVPLGDLVWRVNLMSALCTAGAVTLLFSCGLCVLTQSAPAMSRRSRQTLAALVALIAATAWALWSNAVRAEVYALQALLSAGALRALLSYHAQKNSRALRVAALYLGLALANHHLLAITILLPAVIYVLAAKSRPSWKAVSWIAGIGMLGLTALAYLPLRSLAHPEVNFGAPHTLERFFWTLRGAAFSKSATAEHFSSPVLDSVQVLVALAEALSLPLLLLALMGVGTLFRIQRLRSLGGFLLGVVLTCCAARVLLGFDPETPDHHAYLLPAILSLYLLAIVGLGDLCTRALQARRPLPKAPALACVAVALLLPVQLVANGARANHASAWASDDMAHWELGSLPPRSLVLIAYFQTTFRIWALHAVEGARPDVAILDRSFLTYPGMDQEAKLRYPELADLIDAPLAGIPSPIRALAAIAAERPLRVQMHPNVDPGLASQISPAGAFSIFGPPSEAVDQGAWQIRDMAARQALAKLLRHSSRAEEDDAKRALLWHDVMRLDQYCARRDLGSAARVYQDAKALAPQDTTLIEMAKACGLESEP